ncbi:LysR family transcriptional regulator [Acinetobacter sp. 1000160]|uniref:LysR family transcriptional regulator n=1 Tax=Acinetobacter sp. 1000160 TaxID=1310800 RepID=UPI000451B7BF|nr:LysR family transcriptional regulator [Acinetobacter sp. 1000160]EXB47773.1 bacterial regulatory helix-turn-helix, lysR family protein [Acinetobacter baumannii 146457]EYT19855.1 bacterial regulatory helix-turn-helix, lysR family protein [Acinetobacter sp. 1000160]
MRFDFFDLQLLLHIVSTGSLTKGAELSAISLQAASERIKKLEHYFATPLFIRQTSGVELTTAGHALTEHARRLMQQKDLLEQDMQRFRPTAPESLTLWCNSSAQSEYLPPLLPHYLMLHPEINLDLHEAESSEIVEALTQGVARLGLVSSFFDTRHLQTQEFASDPLVLICPAHHALTRQTQLNLVDALAYGFIGLMPHHSLQQSIETQAKLLGFNIQYRLRLPNFSAIAEVVAKGVGIAIMSARAAQRLQPDYDFYAVQLRGAWANRKLLLAAQDFAQLPHAYQQFAEFLMQHRPSC